MSENLAPEPTGAVAATDVKRTRWAEARDIPVWMSLMRLELVANTLYSIGFAWSLHTSVFGWGPMLVRWLGTLFKKDWSGAAPFFGSTTFVVLLMLLSLNGLRLRLARVRLVRAPTKRDLVASLLVADLRGLVYSLLMLSVIGYLLYVLVFKIRGGFDPLEYIVRVYEFLWGFTQAEHPQWQRKIPWVIRVGAWGVFTALGALVLRILVASFYLLIGGGRTPLEPRIDAPSA